MDKLTSNTLVLNRNWMAIQVCSVKRAINLLYQGHAKAIDQDFSSYNFNDWSQVSQEMVEIDSNEFIFSPTLKLKIPRVIVLMLYDKLPKRHVSFSRKNIFERDKYTCQYCGKKEKETSRNVSQMGKNVLNLDHIVPRSRGGKTTWKNVVVTCCKCNTKKGNKLLEELGWTLFKIPKEPSWLPIINIGLTLKPHKQWINFLDIVYWHVELFNENPKLNDETL